MHFKSAVVACLVVVSLATAPAQAAAATTPAFTVELHEDGSADVAVTYAFDLETDAERQAFARLRDDQSARDAHAARFEERLGAVAATAADRTGREMRVTDAAVDVSAEEATGVVTIRATWHHLAAVEGETLVVTEPFASEFEPDRRFVVVPPAGYAATATPSADERESGRLAWTAGTDLKGFELTATPSTGSDGTGDGAADDGPSGRSGPGFGPTTAVVAALVVGVFARRRR